jgi:ABC-type sugar transport system ATPase subunit
MTDAAIRVAGLKKRFGAVTALDGIDLEVPARTVFGLLGPNGAGKTTAIRVLSTVLEPEGRAEVLGLDVVREAKAVRRQIGLAGQYATVDANLTGRENPTRGRWGGGFRIGGGEPLSPARVAERPAELAFGCRVRGAAGLGPHHDRGLAREEAG